MRIIVKHRHAWISLEEFDSISTKISKMSSQWCLFLRFTFNYKSLKEEVINSWSSSSCLMLAAAFTSSKLINAEYSHTSKPRSLKFAYGLFHRLGHHYHLHRWSMWQKVIKSSITHIKSTDHMSERNEQNKICLLLLGLLLPFYCRFLDFQN